MRISEAKMTENLHTSYIFFWQNIFFMRDKKKTKKNTPKSLRILSTMQFFIVIVLHSSEYGLK